MRSTTPGLFVLLAALWGTSFVAARATLPAVPPIPLAALRFDIAGVLMLGYAALTTHQWLPQTRQDWAVVMVGGVLFVGLHHVLLFAGQQFVTSAVAAVVVSLDPILAAGFARFLLPEERLGPVGAAGLCLGLVGVGIVGNPTVDTAGEGTVLGISLVFMSAVAFALGAVLTQRYRTDLPVASMQAWMMCLGAPLLHLAELLLAFPGFESVTWTPTALFGTAYLAVVAGAGGYLLYFELLDRVGAVEINLVGYAAPVFTAVTGWLVLGEPVTPRTVCGFTAIVLGFVLVKRVALRAALNRRYS